MKHRTPVVAAAVLGVALVLAGCAESPEHQQAASDCNQARDDLTAAIESFQTIGSDQEVSRALQAKAEDIGQTGTDAQAAIQKALGTTVDEDVPECSGGTDQLNSTADDLQNRKSSAQQLTGTARQESKNVATAYAETFKSKASSGNGKAIAAWQFAKTLTPSDTNTPGTPAAALNAAMKSTSVTDATAQLKSAIADWNAAQQKSGWELPGSDERRQLIGAIDNGFTALVAAYFDHLDWMAANPFSTPDQKQVARQGTVDTYQQAPGSALPAKTE